MITKISRMTTIDILKKATIDSVSKTHKSIKAEGIDTITGKLQRRTFQYISDQVLEKAEQYIGRRDPLVIEVDSGTKTIDIRVDGEYRQGKEATITSPL